ncbi:hypothetical protein WJR50_14460 [Catalinimonas sp. 4WD22]|uniref:hypothetical protein n=1 Tax=Catalinimonas locisalis TaxID=3133978 RepID=UPI0031017B60
MKSRNILMVFLLLGSCVQQQKTATESQTSQTIPLSGNIIDLTYNYDSTTIYWPTEDGFQLNVEAEGFTEKGYYYMANSFYSD